MPAEKRNAPDLDKDVEEITLVNAPKRVKIEPPVASVCTIDKVVRNLAGDRVFANAIMWDYAHRGEMEADTLTEALNELQIQGNLRNDSIANLINRFWYLHSKYVAPTCSEIRETYTDVLGHVVSLYETYGDKFLGHTGSASEVLIDRMARECGPPDEAEQSVVGNFDLLKDIFDNTGLRTVVDGWLKEYGYLPDSDGPYKDRVNPQIINGWFFRKEGLLDFCISLISKMCVTVVSVKGKSADDFVAYDLKNIASGNYKRFPSCILLAKVCKLRQQNETTLNTDWWGDRRVQALVDNAIVNSQTRNDITAMFVYSGVDAPNGIIYLLQKQARDMTGRDKTAQSYDDIKVEHRTGNFTPWRTKNGDWPEDSVVEDTNYLAIENRLSGAVGLEEYRKKHKRYRGFKETVAVMDSPRKKTKTKTVQPVEESFEEETPNYALIGGLVAVTAGVAAIAISHS